MTHGRNCMVWIQMVHFGVWEIIKRLGALRMVFNVCIYWRGAWCYLLLNLKVGHCKFGYSSCIISVSFASATAALLVSSLHL